jgi:hypothetical protein
MMDMDRPLKLLMMVVASIAIVSCQKKESVSKTEPAAPPRKVYPFDKSRGCYADGIVNGYVADKTNPLKNHMVMVLSRFQEDDLSSDVLSTLCTGTLVGNNIVLTAAHCFPKNTVSTQIIASINLFCSSGFSKQLVYTAYDVTIHPQYRHKTSPSSTAPDFDIATLKFDGILPPGYTPLPLVPVDIRQEMKNPTNQMVMIGYGRTHTTDDSLPELRYVTKTWDQLMLTKDSVNLIDRLGLVSVNQVDAHGGCSGDSGGPLLVAENGAYKIMGVASYIESVSESKLCEQGQIFYTYVPSYWDWINEQLK